MRTDLLRLLDALNSRLSFNDLRAVGTYSLENNCVPPFFPFLWTAQNSFSWLITLNITFIEIKNQKIQHRLNYQNYKRKSCCHYIHWKLRYNKCTTGKKLKLHEHVVFTVLFSYTDSFEKTGVFFSNNVNSTVTVQTPITWILLFYLWDKS